jgi:hypothetical protein
LFSAEESEEIMMKQQHNNSIRTMSRIALISIFVPLLAFVDCSGELEPTKPLPRGSWTVEPDSACPGDLLEFTWTELEHTTEAKIEPDVGAVNIPTMLHPDLFEETETYKFLAINDDISDFIPLPLIESPPPPGDLQEKTVTNAEELPRQFISATGQRTQERDPAWPGEWICRWETSVPASDASDRVIMNSIKNEMDFGVTVTRVVPSFTYAFGPFEEIDNSNPDFGPASGEKFSGFWGFVPSSAFFVELQEQIDSGELEDCEGFVIQISVVVGCSE